MCRDETSASSGLTLWPASPRDLPPLAVAMQGLMEASINDDLMDGEPVFRQYNAWRTALLRSLRENRTVAGTGNMELVGFRSNGRGRASRAVRACVQGLCTVTKVAQALALAPNPGGRLL